MCVCTFVNGCVCMYVCVCTSIFSFTFFFFSLYVCIFSNFFALTTTSDFTAAIRIATAIAIVVIVIAKRCFMPFLSWLDGLLAAWALIVIVFWHHLLFVICSSSASSQLSFIVGCTLATRSLVGWLMCCLVGRYD